MTKKKIRYSEFPSPVKPPAAPQAEAPKAPRARKTEPARVSAESLPEEKGTVPPVAAEPAVTIEALAPAAAPKLRAPLDLARALAAARAAEASSEAWAKTPAAAMPAIPAPPPLPRATVTMSLSSMTPARGMAAIPQPGMRLTPARGMDVIPQAGMRLTPSHGLAIIPAEPVTPAALPTEVARSLRERARTRSGLVELLVFRMADELFGIDLVCVEEAIDLPPVRHVPEMPAAMLGVITVRGTLTSTYTPESALGLSMASRGSALIFKRGRGRVALVVDDVDDVYTLDLAQLRDAPGSDASDGILIGVVRRADGLLGLVDAEALIAACQAVPVLEIA
jgi:purine-binding chemotaxis protein CheW